MPRHLYAPTRTSPHRQGGFTLLEALVVLVIIGSLAAVGIPSFMQSMNRTTINAQVSAFGNSFKLTRAEAIRRNTRVTMCQSLDPNASPPICAAAPGALGWASGWIIFQDDGATLNEADPNETIIHVQPPFNNSGGFLETGGGAPYRPSFRANGMPVGLVNQTFNVVAPGNLGSKDKLAVRMVVSPQGRIRTEKLNTLAAP